MEYYVVSIKKSNPFDVINQFDFTICAKVTDEEIAKNLMDFYNKNDKSQYCKVHPVMSNIEVEKFLNTH